MVLRSDLLEGRRIALAGDTRPELRDALLGLGAALEPLPCDELSGDEERVGEWARSRAPLHALLYSAGFGEGGERALTTVLDEAWAVVREVAVGALIDADHPGKLVLLAPPSDAGPLAGAAADALENLARTLSVEWARYEITAVTLAPGPATTGEELGTLAAFLVSEAGAYLSGCRIELGAVR